jgi:CubicO group peptidase (beta-lactamase class C family)
MTIRDLLSHRTGLGPGAGDLLFAPRSNLSRAETVRRLRYIKPATSFRSTYSYDNLAYIVLGQLIETVSGERWEGYIDRHVLAPAGMDEATTDLAGRLAVANRAHPNARISGSVRGVGPLVALDEANGLGDNANPAGGIAASAEDMAAWLNVQLSLGVGPGGKRIYSSAQASEMWKPLTIMPIGAPPPGMEALKANFLAYASGWSVRDYRGAKVFAHSGSVLGALAFVALIPDRNVGFSIAINSEDEALVRGLFYELLDHFLNLPAGSWPEKLRVQSDAQMKQAVEIVQASSKPPAKTSPTVELANYTGAYSDPWFGTVKIDEREGNLSLQLPHAPGLSAELQFWRHDTFLARFNDPSVEPIFVTFTFDPDGKVAGVRMKPASPLGGFDFEDLDLKPVTSKD